MDPENRVFLNHLPDLGRSRELRSLYDAMAVKAQTEAKRTAVVELLKSLAASEPLLIVVECFEGELLQQLGFWDESMETYRQASEFARDEIEQCSAWMGVAEGLKSTQAHEELIEVLILLKVLPTWLFDPA